MCATARHQHHVWSYPDATGAKRCLYDGCTIRVRRAYAEWQSQPRGQWTSILKADIPECHGQPPKDGR
jgi:hypothetical protein